jgi:hypothetical protein
MRTINWKWKGVVLGGLLAAGSAGLSNSCGGDDNASTSTTIVVPDAGNPGSGGAGGSDMTTGMAGNGGDNGGSGGGGAGGAGGTGGGGTMCPANGAGTFDNATRLQGLLGPDGGILPL